EDGEEAARDEIEDAALIGSEVVDVVVDVGGNDRVVIVDLRVVDHARERKLVERENVLRRRAVLLDRLQRRRCRLQLRDYVTREVPRRGSRIRDRLLAFVQRLRGLQGAARREAEPTVGVALQRRQVVEERRALGLLLALDGLDGAVLARDLLDDL